MGLKKLGFELKPGTGWETAWAAAPAALAGFQAISAQRQLGKVRTDIDNYRRQDIENPFANLSNPYENLAVATQAAEIKMEQTDQALANTLDTLRETGAAAGGATAIANAALKSKQGIAASIEKQEVDNQRLQAKGQLQVDIAKGKGETVRMQMQENRDINELNRLQAQADMAQYRRDMSIQTGLSALGDAAAVRNAGIVPEKRLKKTDDAIVENVTSPRNSGFGIKDLTDDEIAAKELADKEFLKQQLAGGVGEDTQSDAYRFQQGLMTNEEVSNYLNPSSQSGIVRWDPNDAQSNAEYEAFIKNTNLPN